MFSKNNNNNNTYLFPHDHHHHHHPRSSVVDLNGVELFLHHHHHHHHPDLFSAHHYNNNNNNVPSANLSDNHHHQAAGATNLLLNQDAASSQKKAQTSKKDRHSKIFTSQGPRDRRVRLSIGIARKFFDLQEMLGFDKPSKTLDWLLTKSKAAIKDLIHSKDKSNNNKSSSNESDDLVIPSQQQLLEYGEEAVSSKGKSGKNITKGAGAGASSSTSLAKESRAKARARARERTREKMCIKQMNKNGGGGGENGPCLDSPNPFNAININHQLGLFGQSSNNREAALFQDQDLIQESVSVKRKTKSNLVPSFFGFQQNVFVSMDSGSNYGGVIPFVANNNNNENWDVCSFTSQSNMCAILEQQKFMNSSSNM